MKIPKWLELQAEIDYWYFVLNSMLEKDKKRSGIERMIDEATGWDKEQIKQAKQIMKRINRLKERFYKSSN